MTRIIAVALQKGGVGKTTTAQHLAHALAMRGKDVLLVDLDSQASTTRRYDQTTMKGTLSDVFGAAGPPTKILREIIVPTQQEHLFLVPASEELALTDDRLSLEGGAEFKLDVLFREETLPFDYIILDTAPGKSKLQMAALVASDEIVIPVQLSPMGFEGFKDIDASIAKAREFQSLRGEVRLRYRAVVPTFYAQGQIVSDQFLDALRNAEHPDYAGRAIPLSPLPVPETTAFEQASAPLPFGSIVRAQTIFDLPTGGEDSPTWRGQQAYYQLAEYVDGFIT